MTKRTRFLRGAGAGAVLAAALLGLLGCATESLAVSAKLDDSKEDAGVSSDTDSDTDSDPESETDTEPPWHPSDTTPTTCAEAETRLTSIGCEFFAADLDNWGLSGDYSLSTADGEPFVVVVANPQENKDAEITVEHGADGVLLNASVPPHGIREIFLTCAEELGDCLTESQHIDVQGFKEGAAFRIASDVPVSVYQWNPYSPSNATGESSLLIPVSSLGGDYIAVAWRVGDDQGMDTDNGSQVTIVATEDDTTLTYTPSVDVLGFNGVGPLAAGEESVPISMNALDVMSMSPKDGSGTLEIPFPDDTADLTGTIIRADKPIAVFGGHACAIIMVPITIGDTTYTTVSCDHIEEQLFPYTSWGTSYVLSRYSPRGGLDANVDKTLWRIVAGADDMKVTFDPPAPLPAGKEHAFAKRSDVLEFLGDVDYYAQGVYNNPPDPAAPAAPFMAYQLMSAPVPTNDEGDTAMILAPPTEQYLDRYVFGTNTLGVYDDYIIVIRKPGTEVLLDCVEGFLQDSYFEQVGDGPWEAARIDLDTGDCHDGWHMLTSSEPVGLIQIGTAEVAAYGHMGGVGVATQDVPAL